MTPGPVAGYQAKKPDPGLMVPEDKYAQAKARCPHLLPLYRLFYYPPRHGNPHNWHGLLHLFSSTETFQAQIIPAGNHFYTTVKSNADFAVQHLNYDREGITGYCADGPKCGATKPFLRYSKPGGSFIQSPPDPLRESHSAPTLDHFYTTTIEGINWAAKSGYKAERISCYLWWYSQLLCLPFGKSASGGGHCVLQRRRRI